jgi:hypothetical protein
MGYSHPFDVFFQFHYLRFLPFPISSNRRTVKCPLIAPWASRYFGRCTIRRHTPRSKLILMVVNFGNIKTFSLIINAPRMN